MTGFQNGETVATATTGSLTFATAATAASNVGSYAIDGSGLTANNGNYVFVQDAGNATELSINPATLTYLADPQSRLYGGANPALTGSISGFKKGESVGTATTGAMTFTTAATAGSNVGSYAIDGGGLTALNGNYVFAQDASNATALTINPTTLTYIADPAARLYGAANPTFTGNVTGFQNGETIATATSGALAFTSPATVTSNVGSYAINGSGLTANNGNPRAGRSSISARSALDAQEFGHAGLSLPQGGGARSRARWRAISGPTASARTASCRAGS